MQKEDVMTGLRALVFGGGGIGGTLTAKLCNAGHDVTVVTRNPEISEHIKANGLKANYDGAEHVTRPEAVATVELLDPDARFDVAIIAVPPSSAEKAATDALGFLRDDGQIVCCPNGLIEERLAKTIDPSRIIGGVVSFGASMLGPGHVEQTSTSADGGLTLGRLPGARDTALFEDVVAAFEEVLPTHRTDNLRGVRWSKLALNCAVSSLGALGGDTLGELISYRIVRRLALEVITEVVDVARAEGVELVKVSGTLDLNMVTLGRIERRRQIGAGTLVAKHALLLAVGQKYKNMRSSMLRAIERGRKPPVDFLNGEITTRALVHGIDVPVNQSFVNVIREIGDGARAPGFENIEDIYRQTCEVRGWPIEFIQRAVS